MYDPSFLGTYGRLRQQEMRADADRRRSRRRRGRIVRLRRPFGGRAEAAAPAEDCPAPAREPSPARPAPASCGASQAGCHWDAEPAEADYLQW